MSSQGRGAIRAPADLYPTHPDLALLIAKRLEAKYGERWGDAPRIAEPGSGYGSFLLAARTTWPGSHIEAFEIQEQMVMTTRPAFVTHHHDLLVHGAPEGFDLILGNPPFNVADELIPSLVSQLGDGGVLALVLRLNYLGGQERYRTIWRSIPPSHLMVMPARPGFDPIVGGTDSTEYAVFVWDAKHVGETTMEFLDNTATQSKWAKGDLPPRIDRAHVLERATVLDRNEFGFIAMQGPDVNWLTIAVARADEARHQIAVFQAKAEDFWGQGEPVKAQAFEKKVRQAEKAWAAAQGHVERLNAMVTA